MNTHQIDLSNPDKVLFPKAGLTKKDLIDYYQKIGPQILPYLQDRPLTMHQFPDGIAAEGFFHKSVSGHYPEWINRVEVKKEGGTIVMPVCNERASLVYFANQAMITPHVWLSRKDQPEKPDQLIFDLDPPEGNFEIVREGALKLRELLEEQLRLTTFVKTTGSKGLHVVMPIRRDYPFDDVRSFAKKVAEKLANETPDKFTTAVRKNKRKGRLFLDYLRNAYAQTAVAPYGVRAIGHAPVAVPLRWDEVSDPDLGSQKYTIGNIFRRLGQIDDPWKGFWETDNNLGKAIKKLK